MLDNAKWIGSGIKADAVPEYFVSWKIPVEKTVSESVLTITAPTGEKTEYDLHIERDTYKLTKRTSEEERK